MIDKQREAEILRLHHAEKWPVGTIAAQLGIHHSTVQRVLIQGGISAKSVVTRPSMVDPYVPFIVETLKKYPRLTSSRLHQMVRERGYHGAPDHFRHLVARYRPRPAAEAFLRLRTLPGEQGQVDWAHFGKLQIGRATRVLWAFVMVLSWSRAIFLRFYLSAAMPSFLRGHVDAFRWFSGVPRVLLYDNLKSAVNRLTRAVPSSEALLARAAERGQNLGNMTARLLAMLNAVSADDLEHAIREAVERDMPTLGAVRQLVERRRAELGKPPAVLTRFSTPKAADVIVRSHRLESYDPSDNENES